MCIDLMHSFINVMLGGHPGLNSTHVRPYSLNLEGAVAALSYVPIISPFSLRMYGCLILTHSSLTGLS
jgi:hypothetical protein